jgi:hypothetical protein
LHFSVDASRIIFMFGMEYVEIPREYTPPHFATSKQEEKDICHRKECCVVTIHIYHQSQRIELYHSEEYDFIFRLLDSSSNKDDMLFKNFIMDKFIV